MEERKSRTYWDLFIELGGVNYYKNRYDNGDYDFTFEDFIKEIEFKFKNKLLII